ncbi:hypothetical protein OEZ85_004305 [Tetradesmus obliquus]|uniref:3-hydroxyisobutyrate dehydrogenase n=1 Tax=Tetradesmus obliquus TaxID=3088 RepID=A0ABY8UKA2_TETOB|nr:hypothetical protein OEZ85_004305 [Tetradesmus obliquus]
MLSYAASTLLRPLAGSSAAFGVRMFSAAALGHKVGFIGLGKMGSRMVNHLLDAGTNVVAFDQNRLALNRAKDVAQQHPHGTLEARDCPADISSDPEVPVVITMLRNASDVRDCYLGANGLFKVPGGPSASLFVDCTTVDTATTRKLAAAAGMLQLSPKAPKMPGMALADGKPHLIDAPVTGAVTGAEAGTLTFMVGGNKSAAEAAAPILRTMGSHIIHCGDHGAGISAKLCNNLVLAASMAALAEALALGKRMGLDPAVLTDVLNRGAARCWSSETYNPVPGVLEDPLLPSNRGYKAGLPLSNVSEHLNMLLEAAKVAKSPTPVARSVQSLYERVEQEGLVARSVQSLYERVEQEGLGDKDFSSVFRYVYGSGCDNTEWKDGQQLFSSQVP